MSKTASANVVWAPPPVSVYLDRDVLRATLRRVQDMLLTHKINGGERTLQMAQVCEPKYDDDGERCGTAACIGGWCAILLTGYESSARDMMGKLVGLDRAIRGFNSFDVVNGPKDRLNALFYDFEDTRSYDSPAVAATAIERYLTNKNPWPAGTMPDKLRYRKAT